jgi:competence ComEA-like helix-hairpin-helix protein
MKQNLLAARLREVIFVAALCNVALVAGSCGSLPRQYSSPSGSFSPGSAAGIETNARVQGPGAGSPRGVVVNINTASLSDLEKLPGVGKVLAERIVEHRENYGPFRRAEHLLMVRGISDRKFRAIQQMLTVDQ